MSVPAQDFANRTLRKPAKSERQNGILVALHLPLDWTLLVVNQRFSPAQLRWYDSLQHQSQDAIQAATLVAEWLHLAGFEPFRVIQPSMTIQIVAGGS